MIASLIGILLIIICIAIFVGKNLSNSCAIWFFKDFGETNIIIIIFIAFAAGIVTSLLFMLIGKLMAKAKKISNEPKKDSVKKENQKIEKTEKSKDIEEKSDSEKINSEKSEEIAENKTDNK